ncbi:serine hydrolase domain-containing protein [Liquorilactobacillus vini]|nr:serine hydrolase domain-containing protein [Liquorilactobacillus vini]
MVTDQIVPGLSYAILEKNQVVETEVLGASQLVPEKKPLKPNQLYDLASLTKVIGTTTVILKLISTGQLALADSVKKYLPQFYDPRVTIRELLTHTAAITGYIPHRNQLPAKKLMAALYTLHTGDWLGQRVEYSDLGMIFLGEIIEQLFKKPVQQVITAEVLKPLKMDHSTFSPPAADCVPTTYSPQQGLLQGIVHDPKARILKEHCGSAGLFAPLADLVKFAKWLLADRLSPSLFSERLRDQLFSDQTPTHTAGRSLGWDLRYDRTGQACIYHTGYTGTFMLLDRNSQSSLIGLTNRVHPKEHNQDFLTWRDKIIATYLTEK